MWAPLRSEVERNWWACAVAWCQSAVKRNGGHVANRYVAKSRTVFHIIDSLFYYTWKFEARQKRNILTQNINFIRCMSAWKGAVPFLDYDSRLSQASVASFHLQHSEKKKYFALAWFLDFLGRNIYNTKCYVLAWMKEIAICCSM